MSIAADIYGGSLREHPELIRKLFDSHSRLASRRGYLLQLFGRRRMDEAFPSCHSSGSRRLVLAGDDDPIIPLVKREDNGLASSPEPNSRSITTGTWPWCQRAGRTGPDDRESSCAPGEIAPPIGKPPASRPL